MDHAEEKLNELEALKSIFFDEFQELDPGPPEVFSILIKPDESCIPLSEISAQLHLQVTYTPTYPEDLPLLELTNTELLEEHEVAALLQVAQDSAEEQRGMAMIFGIHASLKEALEKRLTDRVEQKEREEEERRLREEEEERRRYQGTKVTVESFNAWRVGFMKEMEELDKKAAAAAASAASGGPGAKRGKEDQKTRLTGRQLFEKDRSLAKSDVNMLQDGDVTVEDFDKELFAEDMEGLEDSEEEDNVVLAGFTEDDD
ncbi:RWD domain-containing protein 1 [Chytridiales sp. JEL 0842]|nr:RWD domain-containing protein 1 [Chytridiales sp. JEL 0842]